MIVSLFLAKFLGLYLLIVAAIMLLRKEQFEKTFSEIISSNSALAILGILNLFGGLALVVGHSVWEMSWRVIITIIGYLSIFQGIVRLAFPEEVQKRSRMIGDRGYWAIAIVIAVIGLLLAYFGFVRH